MKKIFFLRKFLFCIRLCSLLGFTNAFSVDVSGVDRGRANELSDKGQMQDHLTPTSKIKNGYLFIENIPSDMLDEKNCGWIQEILAIFGMKVDPKDIHFEKNSFKLKLPSCCCCMEPSIDAETENQ